MKTKVYGSTKVHCSHNNSAMKKISYESYFIHAVLNLI